MSVVEMVVLAFTVGLILGILAGDSAARDRYRK